MFWRFWTVAIVVGGIILCSESTASRIDPKLDFNSEDPVDKHPDLAINHKLFNVRVIVDSGRQKQPRHMDAEVFADPEDRKEKKTVGVRTNITIEVSDEEGKPGKNANDEESIENASVPVFKGKPVDANKNRPESKLYFDYSGSREIPVFPKTDEDSFRNLNWFYFQPPATGYWTTAKPRTEDNFIPYGIGFRPSPSPAPYPDYLRVKPCLCKFHDRPVVRQRPERPLIPYDRTEEVYFSRGRSSSDRFGGGSSTSAGIDDKLDFPFHA